MRLIISSFNIIIETAGGRKTVPGGKLTFSNYGWDSTDVTLADEDTNADYANRAIQRNIAMQVAPYGGKISNQWKWPQLVAKFACRTDTCMFKFLVLTRSNLRGSAGWWW